MPKGKLWWAVCVLATLSASCDSRPPAVSERREPVVLYASYADKSYLPELFRAFTDETGIPVTVRHGEPSQIVEDVMADRGSPPADVLLTSNVMDIWRAGDDGALRPMATQNLETIAAFLRDPDRLWAATGFRRAVIAYKPGVRAPLPRNFAELAQPDYRGRLCVASSALAINRAIIAMLIGDLGKRSAELMVRGWMSNAALPPFDTEDQLIAAIDAGTCDFGVVSSQALASEEASVTEGELSVIEPDEAYVDIEAVGIARHARYPESAQALVAWLLTAEVQDRHALRTHLEAARAAYVETADVSQNHVGQAAWHDEDAILLAERAGYR